MPFFDLFHQPWVKCVAYLTMLVGRLWTNMLFGAGDLPTKLAPVIVLLMNLEAVGW
jgi:hypothetical protein